MVPPFPIAVHKLIVLSLEDIEVMIKNQERIRGISVQQQFILTKFRCLVRSDTFLGSFWSAD